MHTIEMPTFCFLLPQSRRFAGSFNFNIVIVAQSIDWDKRCCVFRNLISFMPIFDEKLLDLWCVLLRCLPLMRNTANFWQPLCEFNYRLNHIKSYNMQSETFLIVQILQLGGQFSHIMSVSHNFKIHRHTFTSI